MFIILGYGLPKLTLKEVTEGFVEVKECTFEPKVGGNKRFSNVRSKLSAKPKVREVAPEDNYELQNCTFKPDVKGITPNMKAAKEYVSTDVVERLTRPIVTSPDEMNLTETFDRPVMDVASFMGSIGKPIKDFYMRHQTITAFLSTPQKSMRERD